MSKILIVDNSESACFLLKCFLDEIGYDVIVSYNGIDALNKVKQMKPDIMLLDLKMDGIDGMEVLERIRLFDNRIGIIMVTAVMDEVIGKEAFRKGADEYITKPVDYEHLSECILVDLVMKKRD